MGVTSGVGVGVIGSGVMIPTDEIGDDTEAMGVGCMSTDFCGSSVGVGIMVGESDVCSTGVIATEGELTKESGGTCWA